VKPLKYMIKLFPVSTTTFKQYTCQNITLLQSENKANLFWYR